MLSGDGSDLDHDLLPAFAHHLVCGIVLGGDEAGVDEAKARAIFDFGEAPGHHLVQRRAIASIFVVSSLVRLVPSSRRMA